jgi:hypothetical protein
MARKSKAGRKPRHSGEVLRKNRKFRIRGTLDQRLEDRAAKNGRSTSEEIEHRLETSFQDERVALAQTGSDVGALLLRMFFSGMVLEGIHPDWSGDRDRALRFRVAIDAIIATCTNLPLEYPPPWQRQEGLRLARQLLLRSSIPAERWPSEIVFSELEPLEFGEEKNDDR